MSELGGLWKHQYNPTCTTTSHGVTVSLQTVEAGHYTEEEEQQRQELWC